MHTIKSKTIDILTLLLYISLFLISSESFNGQLISLGAGVVSIAILLVDVFHCPSKVQFKLTPMHYWVILLVLFCYASSLWALQAGLAVDKGNTIAKNGVCIFLIYIYYQKSNNVKYLLKIIMYGGYVLAIFAILFFGMDTIRNTLASSSRITNSFINQNTLGMLVAFTVIINLFFVLYYHEEKRGVPLAVISIFILAVAGSRKSFLELVFGVLFLLLLKNYNRKKILQSLIKIFAALMVFGILLFLLNKLPMFDFINSRLENVIHQLTGYGYTDYSVRSRALLNNLGWQIFKENPILGVGIDCARVLVKQITGIDWYLHNNYLELLTDGGIIGCTLYYFIYGLMLHRFWKYRQYRDKEYDVCLVLMVVQLVLEFAYVSYYSRETYFYLMLYFLETEILRKSVENGNET